MSPVVVHPSPVSNFSKSTEPSATEMVLGIRWSDFFPRQVPSELFVIDLCDTDRALNFVETHFASNHGTSITSGELRRRFYSRFADIFGIYFNGKLVGLQIGHLTDPHAYYLKYGAMDPLYRSRGWMGLLINEIAQVLAIASLSKLEAHVNSTNLVAQSLLHKLGFLPTGSSCSGDWGSMVLLSKFLSPTAADDFSSKFGGRVRLDQTFLNEKERRNT